MIFSNVFPLDWRDLQNQTARYFREAGYVAYSPYTIQTVRGEVELDVYVEAPLELCKAVICECKYWESNVPQAIVHEVRTVVQDCGASMGILIAKNGFQSGAYRAAEKSNVQLKNWHEFLNLIQNQWIKNQVREMKKARRPVSVYMDFMSMPGGLSSKKQDEYFDGMRYYGQFDSKIAFMEYSKVLEYNCERSDFFGCTTVEEYFTYLKSKTTEAINFFDYVFEGIEMPEHLFKFCDSPMEYYF